MDGSDDAADEPEVAGPATPRAGARSLLMTAAAVCVIAASLAVVGWINWNAGTSAASGGRYAVVETPPDADGPVPPAVPSSPQPLVPLLPPDLATRNAPRTGSPHRPATPSDRTVPPRPQTHPVTGPIGAIGGYAGKCLQVPGDPPAEGVQVEMIGCDGHPGERWTLASDGTIRAYGKCLNVAGDAAVNGVGVQLSACHGGPGQQWRFTTGRDLVNANAGKCLDVRDFNPGEGALVQVWTCTGSANQKWSIPA